MNFEALVTQYMRPNGRATPQTTLLPLSSLSDYNDMLKHGCEFEAEVLTTGEVSLTISSLCDDIDCEVVKNGQAVQEALVRMLGRRLWHTNEAPHAE